MEKRDIGFKLINVDSKTEARRASFTTVHGTVQTPAFMVVGTAGFVRSVTTRDVLETETEVLLANTYHLSTSERLATVKRAGGLHRFMAWNKTILTDSGGFQVFSLPEKKVTDDGVYFSFTENGERSFLSPEKSMEIQRDLGADIVMAFDECVEHTAPREYIRKSIKLTTKWAKRCMDVPLQKHQFLFGIIQGGVYMDMRTQSAKEITAIPFDGFAIGGVSVGEGASLMTDVVTHTVQFLPHDKPRYLMGVGLPENLLMAIENGMDIFDCVIPTRYARNGTLFTRMGKMRIMDKSYLKDQYPIDTHCQCYTCKNYSRMILRYLFFSKNSLAETLATIHNITFYQDLMREARLAIEQERFSSFRDSWLETYFRKKNRRK